MTAVNLLKRALFACGVMGAWVAAAPAVHAQGSVPGYPKPE